MKHPSLMNTRYLMLGTGLALSLLSASLTQAEIYKTVDEHGNVTYSDKADGSQSAVELKPANSVPALVTPAPRTDANQEAEGPIKYKKLKIVSPADDSAIEHGPGDFTVTSSIKPALVKGHKMQLFIDGQPHGSPSERTSWALKNVYRGTHTLRVKVFNAEGKVVKKSKTSSVHVFRPSVLLPGSRR